MYFDNIIGQDFAKKYLTNSIKKNKINHAYMFEGIDGIGKKKLSQELSKILLDTENVENSPDYINIYPDGNSIKIAQIRKLQTDIIVKPHNQYKIYIINIYFGVDWLFTSQFFYCFLHFKFTYCKKYILCQKFKNISKIALVYLGGVLLLNKNCQLMNKLKQTRFK